MPEGALHVSVAGTDMVPFTFDPPLTPNPPLVATFESMYDPPESDIALQDVDVATNAYSA